MVGCDTTCKKYNQQYKTEQPYTFHEKMIPLLPLPLAEMNLIYWGLCKSVKIIYSVCTYLHFPEK